MCVVLDVYVCLVFCIGMCFCFQAEDGIRDLVRSRGLGDVYKRQVLAFAIPTKSTRPAFKVFFTCKLETSNTVAGLLLSLIHI